MSSKFVLPVKEWINSMDKEDLKRNIKRLEYKNCQYHRWLSSSILTSNTYPIKQSIMRNHLLINMMKTRLKQLNE